MEAVSSLVKSSNGLRRIDVVIRGKRQKIRLGRMADHLARQVRVRVDALAEAVAIGGRDVDAERWCDRLEPSLHNRLCTLGLIHRKSDETLQGLIERIKKSRSHIKKATAAADKQAYDSLIDEFGGAKPVRSITVVDAQEWRNAMVEAKLSPATIAKRVIKARAVFRQAVKWRLVDSSPMSELRTGSQKNDARKHFVDLERAQSILDACPDAQWRAIFTLARWGGVRIPSEIDSMTWADIIWDKHKFRVISPKTEHHAGGEERYVPLFPEVLTAFQELLELAEPGETLIFKRRTPTNYRKNLLAIIKKAGLSPWPRLWQNLRASRETELCQSFPLPIVCRWIGNSEVVMNKHYAMMTDADFTRAADVRVGGGKAAHKAAHSPAATGRHANRSEGVNATETPENGDIRQKTRISEYPLMGDKGPKPFAGSLGKSHGKRPGGAQSGARALRAARRAERGLADGLRRATGELRRSDRAGIRRLERMVRRAKR
jgi:site-specific recombinase XerD